MSEAQKEAERRYPYPSDGPFSQVKSELNAARQSAFLSGVKWQSEQQATDAQVEAAAKALRADRANRVDTFHVPDWENTSHGYKLVFLGQARAALEAARAVQA